MINKNINYKLSNEILEKFNKGYIGQEPKAKLKCLPTITNAKIIKYTKELLLQTSKSNFVTFIEKYNIPETYIIKAEKLDYKLDYKFLKEVGIYLYPYYSYGVLNGGSATSYVDNKKNRSINNEIFENNQAIFNKLKPSYINKAKGITPAFINPDGTPGPSFMELKIRALLIQADEYKKVTGLNNSNLFPLFQMTSTTNNSEINNYYQSLSNSQYLYTLLNKTKSNILNVKSGIQPLITAFTHSNKGLKKEIFKDINNNELALPGGHGQCFYVLKDILTDLYRSGIKFISIGNVDNIGYTIDPVTLSILAITNKEALFDFSFKTEVDVKGGVLIIDTNNKLNCADIGVAVSKDELSEAENAGKPILFNCATGYFNLETLLKKIDYIINNLPIRFSDQNKDAGEYSQAEQVTWEVISLLEDFGILAVNKYEKFLASKLLIENLITCGVITDISDSILKNNSSKLYNGLKDKLKDSFKLELINNKWRPND